MSRPSFTELVRNTLTGKRFEPVKRLHDWYGYHPHPFPIKGGISGSEIIARNLQGQNMLLKHLIANSKPSKATEDL